MANTNSIVWRRLHEISVAIDNNNAPTRWYTRSGSRAYKYCYDIHKEVWKKVSVITDRVEEEFTDDTAGRYFLSSPIENKTESKNKEEKMAKNKNYIGGSYKIVKVTYMMPDDIDTAGGMLGHTYNFKCDIDVDIVKGNVVAVDSSNGLGLCTVLEVIPDTYENAAEVQKANAWVVDKINMDRHNAKKTATDRQKWLISKLEEKKKQMAVTDMYALIAESDPEAKKLVEELKSLPESLAK